MKNERKPKTPRIAAHPAKKNVQKNALPNEKNNGKSARGSRTLKADGTLTVASLPEQNPNPVMRFARDGKLLYGNPAAESLLGVSTNRPAPDGWSALVQYAFESGSNCETEIEHAGRIFSALFVPVQEAGYVNSYCNDITAQKQTEDALRESEARMRFATQAARACTWELNIQDQSYKLGENFAEVLGFSPDLLPKNSNEVSELINVPEDRQAVREVVMQAVQTRSEVPPLQYRVINPETKETIWLEVNAKLVFSANGNPERMFGMVQNITGRKRAEEILRQKDERLRRITDATPVLFSECSSDLRYLFVNRAAAEFLGAPAEEIIGRPIREIMGDKAWEAILPHVERVLRGERVEYEMEIPYRNAGPRFMHVLYLPEADMQGNVIGWIATVTDITERKRMEDALRDSQARLTQELADSKQLQVTSSQLIREDNIGAMYEKIVRAAMALMRSDMGSLQMLYPEKNQLHLLNAQGFDPASAKFWEWVRVDSGSTCGLALQTGERVIVHDVEASEFIAGTEDLHFYRLSNICAVQSTPLVSRQGRIVGMLSTHWREPHEPGERELQLLDVLARQAADLIERKLSEAELTENARQQAALFKLADQLQRTASQQDIYDAALDAIMNALQCHRASILLFDETNRMRFVAWRELSDTYRHIVDGHSPWDADEKNAQPIYINDIDTADLNNELRTVIKEEGIGSLAFIPLVINGRLIGKFMLYFNSTHEFNEMDIDLSLTISRQLAFALDRQRAQEKLHISEDRLRLAVAAGNIGIWDIDLRRRERTWSKEGKAIYGLAADEFLDYPRQLELTHPEDRELVDQMVTAFRDQGALKQLNFEHRVQHPDGSVHWVEVHGEAIYEDEPLPVRLIGTILDITERKRADEQLRIAAEYDAFRVGLADTLRPLNDPAQIQSEAMRLLGEKLQVDRVFYTEVDEGNETIHTLDNFVKDGVTRLTGYSSLHEYGRARGILSAGQNLVIEDAFIASGMDEKDRATFDSLGIRAGLATPLIKEDRWVATVSVHHGTVRQWTEHEIALLKETAERTWAVLERVRAQQALRASESLYRAIARSIPGGGIYVVDQEFRYMVAEGSVTEAFGLTREILEGHTVAEVFPGERAERMEARLTRNFAGETLNYETPHNGRTYWTQQAPIHDSLGQVIIVTMDITERKRAEDALKQSEERFRQFMEHLPGLAWIKDAQGRYVYANASAQQAFRTSQQELYGKTDLEVFDAAVASQFIQNDQRALREGAVQVVETLEHEEGMIHHSLVTKFPIPGVDGEIAFIGGTAFDITERIQMEEALRQAREAAEATADRLARLQEITAALARSVTSTELSEMILEQGTRASGASAGILVEVVNHGRDVKTLAALGYPERAVRRDPVPLSAPTPVADCIQTKQAVWIGSHEEFAAGYPSLAEFRQGLGNEAVVALPLIVGDHVVGALAFSFVEKRDFMLEERGFLLAVAQQCAQALERVRAAEALRESEERYRFIVESTSDGIWQIELQEPMPLTLSEDEQVEWYYRHAMIHQCNLELARMYGYDSIEPVIGLPMSIVTPFEANVELARQFIRANYRLVNAESREKDRQGRDLYFINNMVGIIEDGKLTGEWGTNRDITERKRAEGRLALLAKVSELAREIEDPIELMAAVANAVGEHLQVKRALFNEIDVENDIEIVHHDYHTGVESVAGVHQLTEYSDVTAHEMMEGSTVVNHDSKMDPRTAKDYERSYLPTGERAYVAVPLMREEEWVASLWVSDDQPRQWRSEDVALLEAAAERTWTAVEKLRIHAALRDSEERLRVTFNTTAVGFARLTPGTHFVEVNQAFCSIVGYTREELLSMNFDHLTHPDYVKSTRDHMTQLLQGQVQSFVIEKLFIRKDSTEVWVQNSISLVRDLDEKPLHLIVISQDITERKRIEEELHQLNLKLEERVDKRTRELQAASELRRMAVAERRQAQDRFAKSFNDSPAAMSITRFEDGMYRNVNPRFIELLEYQIEDVIGHTSLELNIYKNPQERMDLLKAIRDNRGKWDYETQLQTRTGRHLDVTISVVEIELDGEPHILSMIMDVTERNQILAALRASEQQLRTLFDVLPVGVSYVASNGQVLESNRTLERILDITRAELDRGLHRSRQYVRADGTPMPPSEFASTRALTEQRTIKNVETGVIKEGGQVIWTSVSATPISMPEPGVVVITVDVTERKHMDDELRRSHNRYQVLSQRLVEIQEEERRTISRELHDRVGQSLAALNLNLNFMNQAVPATMPAHIKSRLKDAIQLTEETVSTIRDVMADLRPPALDDYGLEAALNAYADTFSRRFGIRVNLVKPDDLLQRFNPNIELTLLRIAQEALTNVAKHSHASRATITLTTDTDSVCLTVEDNGEGIRSWQKANRPGSHGLKIMRERAETFGGSLQVHSFNQKGTRIEVRIPTQDGQPRVHAEAD